jgi:hypothetical protein
MLAKTVEKYLHGVKAWHLLHGEKFPDLVKPTVKVPLQSLAKANALSPSKEKKGTIHLKHLVHLAVSLASGGPKEEAIFNLTLVAFWGMAWLGELISPTPKGELDPRTSEFVSNVSWEGSGSERICILTLCNTKTCKPGEIQIIKLCPLTNLLFPVEAVKQRVSVCNKFDLPTLFSHVDSDGEAVHLTKDSVIRTLNNVWEQGGLKNLAGHSFRIGGALLRYVWALRPTKSAKSASGP